MHSPSKTLKLIRSAQALFFMNATTWLVFAILTLGGMAGRNPDYSIIVILVGVLMLGNAGAMLMSGLAIGKPRSRFFYLALTVLILNIILTVTDEFGVLDLITLWVDLAILSLLMLTRKRTFSRRKNPARSGAARQFNQPTANIYPLR